MKVPKSIMILGREISIEEVGESDLEGGSLGGYYAHSLRRIFTDEDNHELDKFENICHEAAHAAIILSGWDQKLTKREIELLCQLMQMFACDIIKGFSPKKSTPKRRTKK